MIVLRRVVDLEYNRNLRIKVCHVESGKIGFRIEDQAVGAAGKWFFNQKERFDPPVFVGPGMTKFGPTFVGVLQVQVDRYAARGRASRDVEYVC